MKKILLILSAIWLGYGCQTLHVEKTPPTINWKAQREANEIYKTCPTCEVYLRHWDNKILVELPK